MEQPAKRVRVHMFMDADLYEAIWKIIKKRHLSPVRKFSNFVNQVLREYVEQHKNELE